MSTSEQQADAGATSATQGRQVVVNVCHELDDLQSRAHREHVNEGSSGTANRKDNHRSAAVTDADEDVRFEVPVDGVEWNSFFNGVEMNRTPTDDEEDSLGMEEVIRRSHDSIVAMMSPVSSAVFRGSHDQGVGTMPVKKAVCYGVCSTDLSEPVHSIRCGKCSTNMKPIGYGHHARFRHDGEMIASFGSGHMSDDSESAFCIDHPDAADECQDFLLSPPHSYYGLPSTSATTPTTDCVTETEFLTERIAKSVPIVNKKKLQAISGKLSSNKLDKTKPGVVDTSSSYYVEQRHDLKIVVKRSPDKKPSFARHSEAPAFNPYQQLQHGHAAYAASLTPDARPPSAAGHPQHHLPPQQQQQAAAAAAAPSFSNFYGAPASSVSSGFGGGAPTSSFSEHDDVTMCAAAAASVARQNGHQYTHQQSHPRSMVRNNYASLSGGGDARNVLLRAPTHNIRPHNNQKLNAAEIRHQQHMMMRAAQVIGATGSTFNALSQKRSFNVVKAESGERRELPDDHEKLANSPVMKKFRPIVPRQSGVSNNATIASAAAEQRIGVYHASSNKLRPISTSSGVSNPLYAPADGNFPPSATTSVNNGGGTTFVASPPTAVASSSPRIVELIGGAFRYRAPAHFKIHGYRHSIMQKRVAIPQAHQSHLATGGMQQFSFVRFGGSGSASEVPQPISLSPSSFNHHSYTYQNAKPTDFDKNNEVGVTGFVKQQQRSSSSSQISAAENNAQFQNIEPPPVLEAEGRISSGGAPALSAFYSSPNSSTTSSQLLKTYAETRSPLLNSYHKHSQAHYHHQQRADSGLHHIQVIHRQQPQSFQPHLSQQQQQQQQRQQTPPTGNPQLVRVQITNDIGSVMTPTSGQQMRDASATAADDGANGGSAASSMRHSIDTSMPPPSYALHSRGSHTQHTPSRRF